MKYKVIWAAGASKRSLPTIYGDKLGSFLFGDVFYVIEEDIPDRDESTNLGKRWVKLPDNSYVASIYSAQPRLEKVLEVPTEPTVPKIDFDLHVQVRDGLPKSVTMDGKTAYFE